MADIDAKNANLMYSAANEQAIRDGGAAWAIGLGLVRSDAADPFKTAVNTVDGGRIAGIIPAGFEALADGVFASMHLWGRFKDVPVQDSETLAMNSPLANNASGLMRLAVFGDYVVGYSLGVVSGTGQVVTMHLLPEGSQYPYEAGSSGGVEILTTAAKTLDAADHGKTFIATVVDTIFTLPATVLGLKFTAVAGILSVTTGLSLSPAAADAINGGTDDKDWVNTPATDVVGDAATVVGNGTTGWFTSSGIGIWAAEA